MSNTLYLTDFYGLPPEVAKKGRHSIAVYHNKLFTAGVATGKAHLLVGMSTLTPLFESEYTISMLKIVRVGSKFNYFLDDVLMLTRSSDTQIRNLSVLINAINEKLDVIKKGRTLMRHHAHAALENIAIVDAASQRLIFAAETTFVPRLKLALQPDILMTSNVAFGLSNKVKDAFGYVSLTNTLRERHYLKDLHKYERVYSLIRDLSEQVKFGMIYELLSTVRNGACKKSETLQNGYWEKFLDSCFGVLEVNKVDFNLGATGMAEELKKHLGSFDTEVAVDYVLTRTILCVENLFKYKCSKPELFCSKIKSICSESSGATSSANSGVTGGAIL